LNAAYVIPTDDFDRVDVQLIALSGAYDDPEPSGTAHLTVHLAAFSSDFTVLRNPRARDIHATSHDMFKVYTNSGKPSELEMLLQLSRAVLHAPVLPNGFAESEIDIVRGVLRTMHGHAAAKGLELLTLSDERCKISGTSYRLPDWAKIFEFLAPHYLPSHRDVLSAVASVIAPEG